MPLARVCKAASYTMGHFGKWRLGTMSREGKRREHVALAKGSIEGRAGHCQRAASVPAISLRLSSIDRIFCTIQ